MSDRRPNILLFLTDDHAQWASSCYGHAHIPTPNMQHIADRGVRFTRAFTPSPVCSPARASLFTGRFPSQHGIHDWLEERPDAPRHPGLRGQITLPQQLQSNGYYTGLVGKWHCGGTASEVAPGFDRWFSYWEDQFPHRGRQRFNDQGRLVVQDGYQTPMFTDRAIDVLRSRPSDRPFFLTIGYVDTHSPWSDHPPRLVAARASAGKGIPEEPFAPCHGQPFLRIPDDPAAHRHRQAQHAAGVQMIDEQIGRVLDELDSASELDQTLVIYTSDHGLMCGQHGMYGKGNGTTPQNFLDESILVPLLMSWPSVLPRGHTCSAMVDHCDLYGTLLDAAGIQIDRAAQEELRFPGRSFLPLLLGREQRPWRDAQFCEYGNARMIRTEQFKYIARASVYGRRYEDELYDLRQDPRETTNVIGDVAYRETVATLSQALRQHFEFFVEPRRDGWHIESQPACNSDMPWLRGIAPQAPPAPDAPPIV